MVILFLTIPGCTPGPDSEENLDVTGNWSGSFYGGDGVNFSIVINVLTQYPDPANAAKDLIEGIWSSPNAGIGPPPVSGDINTGYISSGYYLMLYLEKSTGDACYYRINISDYLRTNQASGEAESLLDTGAYMDRSCIRSVGTIELSRS